MKAHGPARNPIGYTEKGIIFYFFPQKVSCANKSFHFNYSLVSLFVYEANRQPKYIIELYIRYSKWLETVEIKHMNVSIRCN